MKTKASLLAAALLGATAMMPAHAAPHRFDHVLLISVDGMHDADLIRYVTDPAHASSAFTSLVAHGVSFPLAFTTAPSDSFPGMIAQVTGGGPRSAEVWYDDSYDRTLFAPGSGCAGDPGAEVNYAENIDRSLANVSAGGTLGQPLTQIDPTQLPMSKATGACLPLLPHQYLRVNTLFEVLHQAGRRTAWADKHPAYEILNGPSGSGIDDLFTPEIDSYIPGTTKSNTKSFTATRGNDELKVRAVLNEIDGLDSTGRHAAPVPAIFGMDFQAVSVGQKLAVSGPTDPAGLVGGFTDANATPGSALAIQLAYVDNAIGRIESELAAKGLLADTLVILSAKHGQSPIDPTQRQAISDAPLTATPGYGFEIADDEVLLWLAPKAQRSQHQAAASYLQSIQAAEGIDALVSRPLLSLLYSDPYADSRTPDFVGVSHQGVIYTTGTKLAEHGGFSFDDRNVPLVVSNPAFSPRIQPLPVQTTQIAPTILAALGLDPSSLKAVRIEGTKVLPLGE